MKPVRINSLTGLRAIVMMTIFCCHLSFLYETPLEAFYSLIKNGRFGVNFFLVLSGFVLALGYSNKVNDNTVNQDLNFVKKRISKIYIPYILTMVLAIPLYIFNYLIEEGAFSVKLLISRLIINIGMIQSVIPFLKYSTSINHVSWFISTIFIIYLFTPAILRLNNKAAKHDNLVNIGFRIFAVLFIYCCVYMVIRQIEYVWFADRYLSIIYCSPLIRIFPFLMGITGYNIYCLLGDCRIKNGSFVEIACIAVFFLWWITEDKIGFPTVVTECVDMIISLLVILVFVLSRKGIISTLLCKEKIQYLGNISMEFYLIHYLVIHYGMIAAEYLRLNNGIAVIPLTILYFVLSLYGARLIHSFAEWSLLKLKKKDSTVTG